MLHLRRDVREFLGDNNEILYIRNTSYATDGGSQGRYYCYICPNGTLDTVDVIEVTCGTNASVLVTVLGELFSLAFKAIFGLVMHHGV